MVASSKKLPESLGQCQCGSLQNNNVLAFWSPRRATKAINGSCPFSTPTADPAATDDELMEAARSWRHALGFDAERTDSPKFTSFIEPLMLALSKNPEGLSSAEHARPSLPSLP